MEATGSVGHDEDALVVGESPIEKLLREAPWTYLVELAPDTARVRRDEDAAGSDRMEAEDQDFYHRVAAAYDALADEHPDRIQRLDGHRSIEALHATIRADVEALLGGDSGTAHARTGSSGP